MLAGAATVLPAGCLRAEAGLAEDGVGSEAGVRVGFAVLELPARPFPCCDEPFGVELGKGAKNVEIGRCPGVAVKLRLVVMLVSSRHTSTNSDYDAAMQPLRCNVAKYSKTFSCALHDGAVATDCPALMISGLDHKRRLLKAINKAESLNVLDPT